jgi:predicted acetyltransferase
VTVRPAAPDEELGALTADSVAFSLPDSTARAERDHAIIGSGRFHLVELDGRVVGNTAAIPFELTVPGGATVAAAGVTAVGVVPTHRRRGVGRALMAAQLDDVAERGEPVAVLTASESQIYRRFGYGVATLAAHVAIDPRWAAMLVAPRAGGTVRLADRSRDDVVALVAEAAHRAVRARPGGLIRPRSVWAGVLAEERSFVGGGNPHVVLHLDDEGSPDGYLLYTATTSWDDGANPDGRLTVGELGGVSPEVEAALVDVACSVDLMVEVTMWRPADDWLRHRLVAPRQLRTRMVTDHLWVRLVDVAAALTARRYGGGPDRLVLEVVDRFRPASGGRFALEVDTDGTGRAEPSGDEPDLVLDVAELGSAWLGGVRVVDLAAAGLVAERTPGALARADAVLRWTPTPWCTARF